MIFENKVVLVTGALGGIGSAIVMAMLGKGARAGLVDINADAGNEFQNTLTSAGHSVLYVNADAGKFSDCEIAVAAIRDTLGDIDILVNNVGVSPKQDGHALKVWEMPPEEWDNVVSVNLSSAFYMTHLVVPAMIRKRSGRIINMSSVAGKTYCDIVAAHYAATKAALIGATRHWAGELGEYNITVNGLAPGRINTPLLKTVSQSTNDAVTKATALKRLGTPEEVADACVFFASDQARFITGQILDVSGGWLMT